MFYPVRRGRGGYNKDATGGAAPRQPKRPFRTTPTLQVIENNQTDLLPRQTQGTFIFGRIQGFGISPLLEVMSRKRRLGSLAL